MEHESNARILWRKAQAGDTAAYDELFALHTDRLLVFIRARLGTGLREKIEAEDVLQDAYMIAHRSYDGFDYVDDGAFLRWMCRIINNRLCDASDYFMAQKRQPVLCPRSSPTGPVTALRRVENQQQIEAALQQLSDDHREVLLLRYFEGLSAEATGKRLGKTAGAVRNLVARALVALGKHLQKNDETTQ